MHNPVNLLREQIEQQAGITQDKSKGPSAEEVTKELERLRALHEGWIKHPITIQVIRKLELEFYNAQNAAFQDARFSTISNKTLEAAVLNDILKYIKTLI